jgi:2-polyprenyl-3-methyl-5-hydroxy-6-metoxy-1,4-benzoquinol methylase
MAHQSWRQLLHKNPGHSAWYVERFRTMAQAGDDLDGEARFIDALAHREARILDAGCGPGRVGGVLAAQGHTVVGVDLDPVLIDAAHEDWPGPTWLVRDLAHLDLPADGIDEPFDVIVCAGNVMAFVEIADRVRVLERLGAHLAPEGRIAIGFGAGRGYPFDDFRADVATAGLAVDLELATWDVRPFTPDSDWLLALLRHPAPAPAPSS